MSLFSSRTGLALLTGVCVAPALWACSLGDTVTPSASEASEAMPTTATGGTSKAGTGETLDVGVSFADNFEELDTENWVVSDRGPPGDWQNCAWNPDNVNVTDGMLVIDYSNEAHRELPLSCGAMQRNGRFGYGTYEARMRTNAGTGLNAAFFTYIGPVHGKPHDEIDIELLGAHPDRTSPNVFVAGRPLALESVPIRGNIREFHTYGFRWMPNRISFYVDGVEITTVTDSRSLPQHAQKIIVSLWSSDTFADWMGEFELPTAPTHLEFDWVAFTRLDESCRFETSLACDFQ